MTLAIAGLWWLVCRAGQRVAVGMWLIVAAATCVVVVAVAPWAWHALANLHLVGEPGRLIAYPIVHPWRNVTRWNEPVLLALAIGGGVAAVAVGPMLARVLAFHGVVCLAIAQYWVVLKIWAPPWFAITTIPFDEWLGADRLFTTRLQYPYGGKQSAIFAVRP